jgi:hypothetical protein
MFQLADHNYQSLLTCVNTVLASAGTYTGVWIPPGRFYARGDFSLPDNISIKGAGIWYSKFSAVDTAPPTSVTANGKTGIAGTTGNLTFTSNGGGLSNSSNVLLSDFSMFGNLTQRDAVDTGTTPHGVDGEFTSSTFNNLWIEHYLGGVLTIKVSTNVTYSGLRARDMFGDGIDFYGNTSDSTITNSQARNTGDDAFAIWSQLATGVSTNNTISNCVAQLPWWGNGFAIYGGTNDTLINNQVYDTLTSSGLSVSTGFVSASLPSSYVMQGTMVSKTNLYRCGGPDFGSQVAAVRVGVMTENVDGLTIDQLNIQDPTYHGVAIGFMPTTSPPPSEGTFTNFTLSNVQIQSTHACTDVKAPITGNAQLNNVCLCDPVQMTASSCTLNNSAATTFQIQSNTCTQTVCTPF